MFLRRMLVLMRGHAVVLLFCVVTAGVAEAKTIAAKSAKQDDVMAAIAEATYGDIVQVPGNAEDTWVAKAQGCYGGEVDTMLCMKQGITLQGGVGGKTTVKLSGSAPRGAIRYEPDEQSIADDVPFEISGFTIDGDGQPFGAGMVDVNNSGTKVITRVKIHDMIFENNDTEVIEINGPVYGVAYSNTFIECQTVIRAEGGDYHSWDLGHREYGTANSFFFEDNVVQSTSTPSTGAFTAGQGGGLVVRYNQVDFGGVLFDGGQWQDLHGLQSMATVPGFDCRNEEGRDVGCGYSVCKPSPVGSCDETQTVCEQWSQVKTEYYGNLATNFQNPYSTGPEWMRLRGSWMLMFNNVVLGSGHMPIPDIYQYSCDSCQSNGGQGKRYSQHVQNTYVWNNIGEGEENRPIYVLQDVCADYSAEKPYAITEGKDFWNYDAACSGTEGCSSGIGIGTSAPTGSCTPGVGFWVWSEGQNVPAAMEELKEHTQAGRFYRCSTEGTWVDYYHPFTYPHPLRESGGTGGGTTGGTSGTSCGCAGAGISQTVALVAVVFFLALARKRKGTMRE